MKYKQLALQKLEKLSNSVKTLEHHLSRNENAKALQILNDVKDKLEDFNNQISIEQDQFRTNQLI